MSKQNSADAYQGFINDLIYVDGPAFKAWVEALHIKLPRRLRYQALKAALYDSINQARQVQTAQSAQSSLKERYYLNRFEHWLESDFLNYLNQQNDDDLNKTYLKTLWQQVLNWLKAQPRLEASLKATLINLINDVEHSPMTNIKAFNETINAVFMDEAGFIEGVSYQDFMAALSEFETMPRALAIAKSHGLTLNRTMNKTALCLILKQFLPEHENQIDQTARISDLEALAKEHQLPLKRYLSKADIAKLIIVYKKQQAPIKKPDTSLEKTSDINDFDTRLKCVEAMLSRIETHLIGEDIVSSNPPKTVTYKRSIFLDVVASFFMLYLFVGLLSYFLDGLAPFTLLNNTINRITYREIGLMELYHNVIDFVIRG